MPNKFTSSEQHIAAAFKIFDERGIDFSTEQVKGLCGEIGVSEPQFYRYRRMYIAKDAPEETVDDKFEKLLNDTLERAMQGKNPQYNRVYKEMLEYKRRLGEGQNRELSADEINSLAIRVRDAIIRGFKEGGGRCPVCGFTKVLCENPREDTGREHGEHSEVAAVGLPT